MSLKLSFRLSYFTLFALALFSSSLFSTGAQAEKIKIGVSVPLSGAGASYGTDIRNALVFANEKIGNGAYELLIEDDQCSDKEAVSIAHKFVDVHKVKYALGFGCSGTVLASAPVYEAGKVIVIASGTGAPAITNAGDYIFRTKPSLTIAAELLAKEFAAHYKKVAAVTEETAFCQGLTKATSEASAKLGVEVLNENYLPGNDDFRSIYPRLRVKQAEAIFLNPQGEPGLVSQFKQFKALGWNIPVYGTFTPGSPAFLKAAGKDADGIIFADLQFNSEMLNAEGRKLYEEFQKRFGPPQSAEHYSALSLVSYATLDEAIKSGKDVKQYLYEHTFKNYVEGNGYSFDKNGDVVSDEVTYVLKTVKDATVAPIK